MASARTRLATVMMVALGLSACSDDTTPAATTPAGATNGVPMDAMGTAATDMAAVQTPGAVPPTGAGVPTNTATPGTGAPMTVTTPTPADMSTSTPGTAVMPMDGAAMAGMMAAAPGMTDGMTDPAAGDGTMPTGDGMTGDGMMAPAPSGEFTLSSTAVMDGALLPDEYRCENDSIFGPPGMSPPLSWTAGPEGTMSYTLVFKDITPGFSMNFMHWVIADIPATTMELPAAFPTGDMPADIPGARQFTGYLGPCAASGTNQYQFTLYAIGTPTLSNATSADSAESAAMANNLGTATLKISSMP